MGELMATQPTFGRYAEIALEQMTPEQRKGYDAIIKARGMCPGPSKIWVENPTAMKLTVPLGVFYRSESSLTEAEREIAVLLTVAKWGADFAISEHEWIAQGTSGYSHAAIPADKVERLIVGLPVTFDDSRQQIVYEVASALTNSRYVPKGLYDRAVREIGNNGITDLALIMGYFTMVAFTLMFHDVPSFAQGMQR
jgi:4-carboxymuconolactone decarboxylase